MDEIAVDRIMESLDALAAKLGTTAEYLWAVLVKQAPVQGGMTLIGMGVSIIAAGVLYKVVMRMGVPICGKEEDAKILRMIMRLLLVVWVWLTVGPCVGGVLKAFASPEFWALEKLSEMF